MRKNKTTVESRKPRKRKYRRRSSIAYIPSSSSRYHNKPSKFIKFNKSKTRACFNGKEISTVKIEKYINHEYFYFRNMDITSFDVYFRFKNLRSLDVSCNYLTDLSFLMNMPNLQMLFAISNSISSFEDVYFPPKLVTLSLSDNKISNFKGFGDLNYLKVLNLKSNKIVSLSHFPNLPSLEIVDIRKNPIYSKSIKEVLLSLVSDTIIKINNKLITKMDFLKARRSSSIKESAKLGFFPKPSSKIPIKIQVDNFFFERNRQILIDNDCEYLELLKSNFSNKSICKDVEFRPFILFKIKNDDHKFNLISGLGKYQFKIKQPKKPIKKMYLHICGVKILMNFNIVEHSLTLVLPIGLYEYKYSSEKIKRKVEIKESRENSKDDIDFNFSSKWLIGNSKGEYSYIQNRDNTFHYIPDQDDVGKSLKYILEIKNLHDNQNIFHIFFITNEISIRDD